MLILPQKFKWTICNTIVPPLMKITYFLGHFKSSEENYNLATPDQVDPQENLTRIFNPERAD